MRSADSWKRFTSTISLMRDNLIFLGTCLKAVRFQLGWDLSSVSNFVLVPMFPIHLPDIALVFAVPQEFLRQADGFEIRLTSVRRELLLSTITFAPFSSGPLTQEVLISEIQSGPQPLLPTKPQTEHVTRAIAQEDASHILLCAPTPGFQVMEPSRIRITQHCKDVVRDLGVFTVEFLKTPDLTSDELRDIRRRGKGNIATLNLVCKKCNLKLLVTKNVSASGGPPESSIPQMRVEDLPPHFSCTCGEVQFDTRFLKLGIHEIFRHKFQSDRDVIRLSSCYRPTSLSSIMTRYRKLIESTPSEEIVQQFLEEHPIMWSFLGPLTIIPKPRLSTHYTADFAILARTRTLFFIEIEKPQTKLAKQSGGQSAELQFGKDQIDSWRTWIADNRQSVLAELRIAPDEVHAIRYVLVAGLESATNADELRAVREGIKDDVQFFTFDQLLGFIGNIDRATSDMAS
jgi:hypothetical protein